VKEKERKIAMADKREMANTFEKLGLLLASGVPILEALDVVGGECSDETTVKALAVYRDRAGDREATKESVSEILCEYGDKFPKSVQLLWKAGQLSGSGNGMADCCFRIATVLRMDPTT
jgi:type II secretory pathway component PulF